ncbi:MAG: hypothetical protein ASARMPREDX12_006386 [Alectoria sarmentosa]|nr:MAG: hypothetical protein ASARMPREDX12_006386 [Alectoria sarmentosa]
MGTQKDPKAKKPTRSSSRVSAKTHSREPNSTLRPTKSPHFPYASIIKPRQTREKWQPWESESLISLRKEGKGLGEISQQLPGRSKMACAKEYQRMLKSRKQASTSEKKNSLADIQETKRPWKEWEDQLVTTSRIAAGAVSARWVDYLKTHLEDTFTAPGYRWSQREDQLLISLHVAGEGFAEIAQKIPNRSESGCKRRWHKIKDCRPELLKRWTILEEKTLVSLFNTLGPRWHGIAKELPGRTHQACEKHYYERTCSGKVGASGPSREDWISHWDNTPDSEETEMDSMEPDFAVHDENGDVGLDIEEPTFKRDQHSRSYNAKKRNVIHVPMVNGRPNLSSWTRFLPVTQSKTTRLFVQSDTLHVAMRDHVTWSIIACASSDFWALFGGYRPDPQEEAKLRERKARKDRAVALLKAQSRARSGSQPQQQAQTQPPAVPQPALVGLSNQSAPP